MTERDKELGSVDDQNGLAERFDADRARLRTVAHRLDVTVLDD